MSILKELFILLIKYMIEFDTTENTNNNSYEYAPIPPKKSFSTNSIEYITNLKIKCLQIYEGERSIKVQADR